jgi:sRNA-binding protein
MPTKVQLSAAQIRDATSTWCHGNYWACLTDGAVRADLTGAAACQATARDSAFARSRTKGATARVGGGSSGAGNVVMTLITSLCKHLSSISGWGRRA